MNNDEKKSNKKREIWGGGVKIEEYKSESLGD